MKRTSRPDYRICIEDPPIAAVDPAEIVSLRMGLPRPPKHTGEHINNDSLDNTRRNLAWATKSEQIANQRRRISKAEKVAFAVAAEVPS